MRRWSDREDGELRALADRGVTMEEAAVALSRSLDAVKGRAHRLGVHFHGPMGRKPGSKDKRPRKRADGMWTRRNDRDLVECLSSGWSYEDAALELGVTVADVEARVRELEKRQHQGAKYEE